MNMLELQVSMWKLDEDFITEKETDEIVDAVLSVIEEKFLEYDSSIWWRTNPAIMINREDK